jgi:hypothetical protein
MTANKRYEKRTELKSCVLVISYNNGNLLGLEVYLSIYYVFHVFVIRKASLARHNSIIFEIMDVLLFDKQLRFWHLFAVLESFVSGK